MPFDEVAENLEISKHENLKLIAGWVDESLLEKEATSIQHFAFAIIDTDLYSPCKSILNYLDSRLVHDGVLAFDEWTYDSEKGETRAFIEYLENNTSWDFDLLATIHWRVYFRVRKTNTPSEIKQVAVQATSIKNNNNLKIWEKLRDLLSSKF